MSGFDLGTIPERDVVVSSRIRLARNVKGYPFPFKMGRDQSSVILEEVKNAVLNSGNSLVKKVMFIDLQSLSAIDREALVERNIISRDLAQSHAQTGVLVSKDEKISIMINEEDHIRIQSLFPGMQMEEARNLCDEIDNLLENKLEYAYSRNYGYLTCCPTNLGTGIRASVMMHLPALTMTGYISGILEACGKLGIAVRGLHGENSQAHGNMFQISNQVTLGKTDEELIGNISSITKQIIEQERILRNELYKQNSFRFEDKVFRSLGILENARIISSDESLKILSDVRLGVDMGIIKNVKIETLDEIIIAIQPANLQKIAGRPLNPDERDIKRADLIRKRITCEKE
ncbi:MAG: protein arginine kinase [Clostridia bacterium]|nr:protein arginine kinase [Clostridia bacterium]